MKVNLAPRPWRGSGDFHMAVDELLWRRGEGIWLRFYRFDPIAITVGYNQKLDNIDLNRIKNYGIDVVRRPTGGRAVFHSGDLTYSLVVPRYDRFWGGSPITVYQRIGSMFSLTLKKLGLNVKFENSRHGVGRHFSCFASISQYELTFKGRKILGSAQRRGDKSILAQGSLLVDPPAVDPRKVMDDPDFPCWAINTLAERKVEMVEIVETFKEVLNDHGFCIEEVELPEDIIEQAYVCVKDYRLS